MTTATQAMNPSPESPATFEAMGLSSLALSSLARIGFQRPTPIQAGAIPPALLGRDVIGCAATGTGKSAAFTLPMLERLTGKTGTRGLILAPTRELAHQIAVQVEALGGSRNIRAVTIIGGMSIEAQTQALRHKPAIIVATPGRLVDHIQQRTADLSGIEVLVLDEADRMLDMGFRPQLTRILARLPRERQTMLFSATIAGEVAEFVKLAGLRNAIRVEVSRSGTTPERAEQRVYLLGQNEKLALLLMLLEQEKTTTLHSDQAPRRQGRSCGGARRPRHRPPALESFTGPAATGPGGLPRGQVSGIGCHRHRGARIGCPGDRSRGEFRSSSRSGRLRSSDWSNRSSGGQWTGDDARRPRRARVAHRY